MEKSVAGSSSLGHKLIWDYGEMRHITYSAQFLTCIRGTEGTAKMRDGDIVKILNVSTLVLIYTMDAI